MTRGKVLHILSQRPFLTGSGVTLDALVRCAARRDWEQAAVVGVPEDEPAAVLGGLPQSRIWPLTFGNAAADLPFDLPGMSDVMPYASSRFSALPAEELAAYRAAWRRHLALVMSQYEPQIIHCHHAWLVGASLKEVAPKTPVVIHGHGTGLRQLARCPHLAAEVRQGIGRNDRLLALHRAQAGQYARELGFDPARIEVVGAGFREEIFHGEQRRRDGPPSLLYAGKLSAAKGLPWLLDAVHRLGRQYPGLTLHVAGSGSGREAEDLRIRMAMLAPQVVSHGHVDQETLAGLMRRSQVFVLPSFFEGLPLVLVEALACGCRPICTLLPGVVDELQPILGDVLIGVPLPRLQDVDQPRPEDLPAFVDNLVGSIRRALDLYAEHGPARVDLSAFTWPAVFARVERVWETLLATR